MAVASRSPKMPLAFTCLAAVLGIGVLVLAPQGFSHHHDQLTRQAVHHDMHPPDAFAFAVITDNPLAISHMPQRRKNELLQSVRMNLNSQFVSSLHLLNQVANDTLYPRGKLHVYDLGWRSTFLDAIRYANAVLPPNTMFAIANADIVFSHETVGVLPRIKDPGVVVALSRHEVRDDGRATIHEDPSLSQDAWLMRTPFPEDPGFDFPMGTLGSDNNLAYIFKRRLNKTVVNWCHDVMILHFHSSQHRAAKARIPQPYERVPSTRVDLSMLYLSWRWRTLIIRPSATSWRHAHWLPVLSIVLDLPRLPGDPMTTLSVDSHGVSPGWSDDAVAQMQTVAEKRIRLRSKTPRLGLAQRHKAVYFLDAPWHLLFATESISNDLVKHLMASFPLTHLFALVPEDVVPAMCRALGWREIGWGAIDARGVFKGELVCPPVMAGLG